MPASDEQRRSFFQRLGSLLAAQAPAPAVPNSTLAFFVEDFLMGLEEQNGRLDPDDAAALDRHAKTLLKNGCKVVTEGSNTGWDLSTISCPTGDVAYGVIVNGQFQNGANGTDFGAGDDTIRVNATAGD